MQGPSLLKNDPIHPLVDQRVRVTRGAHKGYYALVKYVGRDDVTIEIEAHLVSRSSAQQRISWADLVIVFVLFSFYSVTSLICSHKAKDGAFNIPSAGASPHTTNCRSSGPIPDSHAGT
jgi:hypothetical protein